MRFNQLERDIAAPSPFALASVLRKLERDGIVTRKVIHPFPPAHVEYDLTELGRGLATSASAVIEWLDKNFHHVEVARQNSMSTREAERALAMRGIPSGAPIPGSINTRAV